MCAKTTTNPWDYDHDDFTREDWRNQVRGNETLLGYREWVDVQLELNGREDEIDRPDPIIVEIKDGTIAEIHNIPSGVEVRMEEFGLDDLEDFDSEDSLVAPGTEVHVRKFPDL